MVNSGCLSRLNAHTVLPIIYGPLYKNSSGHWNATVEGLAQNVLKMYMVTTEKLPKYVPFLKDTVSPDWHEKLSPCYSTNSF